jgi:hypothetical protein
VVVIAVKNITFETSQQLVGTPNARKIKASTRLWLDKNLTASVPKGFEQCGILGHPPADKVIPPALLLASLKDRQIPLVLRVCGFWTTSPILN